MAGLVHPRLRTALLPHELMNKQERTIELRTGKPITPLESARHETDQGLIEFLRWRTYLLAHRRKPTRVTGAAREVARLSPLSESGDTAVYVATASEIPALLDEIGQHREEAFRAVGEGTGRDRDLDEFDARYRHLFAWNTAKRELVGAYRLCLTDGSTPPRSLYTHTLFDYGAPFLKALGPAIELGRSFIRPEYQKKPTALLMLWKGIASLCGASGGEQRILFGPVSISNSYSPLSRKLLASYLRQHHWDAKLAGMVKARAPFALNPERLPVADISDLNGAILDIEGDLGVPVLLRHYLKIGARVAGFNIDAKFGQCLDGLMIADPARTDGSRMRRYTNTVNADSAAASELLSTGR